jgi:hypothetical protein
MGIIETGGAGNDRISPMSMSCRRARPHSGHSDRTKGPRRRLALRTRIGRHEGPTIASSTPCQRPRPALTRAKRMRMIVGTQEEGVGGHGAYCRSYPLPDYVLRLMASFSDTREKGYADVHIHFHGEREEGDTRRSLVLFPARRRKRQHDPRSCQPCFSFRTARFPPGSRPRGPRNLRPRYLDRKRERQGPRFSSITGRPPIRAIRKTGRTR